MGFPQICCYWVEYNIVEISIWLELCLGHLQWLLRIVLSTASFDQVFYLLLSYYSATLFYLTKPDDNSPELRSFIPARLLKRAVKLMVDVMEEHDQQQSVGYLPFNYNCTTGIVILFIFCT